MQLFDTIQNIFRLVVEYGILLMEATGVVILVVTAVKCIVLLLRKRPHARLELAEGIALSLEFKLGGEVLRTVIVRDWSELAILGAVILLRGALTLLIQWEIRNEMKKLS